MKGWERIEGGFQQGMLGAEELGAMWDAGSRATVNRRPELGLAPQN